MKYIRVFWLHNFDDEPVELYSELDDNYWEVRKIEIFPNGTVSVADSNSSTAGTTLGLEPVPPLEDIARDPEFRVFEIEQEESPAQVGHSVPGYLLPD